MSWGTKERPRKNHIKYVFMIREKPTVVFSVKENTPVYLIGYLTDDHRVLFDKFAIPDRKYFSRGTIVEFIKRILTKRYIDYTTKVYYCFETPGVNFRTHNILFLLWKIFNMSARFPMQSIKLSAIINYMWVLGFAKDPKEGKFSAHKIKHYQNRLNDIYYTILNRKVCPWISEHTEAAIQKLRSEDVRNAHRIVCVGLMHIFKWNQYRRKTFVPSETRNNGFHDMWN